MGLQGQGNPQTYLSLSLLLSRFVHKLQQQMREAPLGSHPSSAIPSLEKGLQSEGCILGVSQQRVSSGDRPRNLNTGGGGSSLEY